MNEPIFEIKTVAEEDKYGKFEITPLVGGYGNTIGTALRRVLLSSLPGAAATSVKISGVKHQFSTLKGMREDVLDFVLNLKKIRFSYDGEDEVKARLTATKVGEVKAGDIETPTGVKIANPELVLANLSDGSKIDAQVNIKSGVGYSPATDRPQEEVGLIPLDASFSPVERINFTTEETRVGQLTNYDKLVFEMWTDGTVNPKDALVKAASILVSYFDQIVNPREIKEQEEDGADEGLGPVGNLSVEEIGLPTRVANALARAGFDTVDKLAVAERTDLVKVRNLGEKSIDTIREALKEKGVEMANA